MWWKIVLGIIGVVILAAGIFAGSHFLRRTVAPIEGATGRIEFTEGVFYSIQEYNRFFELVNEIEADEAILSIYPERLSGAQRIECMGISAQRARRVAEFNAASQQAMTSAKWKADGLPLKLYHVNIRAC